jgi:chromate reductase, NAD(P)H dehydrogenase (quinone)
MATRTHRGEIEMSKTVAVIVGSLRRDSLSKKTAAAIASFSPADTRFELIPIGDLPLYNEDLDNDSPPAQWTEFRRRIKAADAVLFATPEYNRSVPGALKNALDVGSRPYGQNAFDGKPGAVVSISVGGIGGFGANHHLRQSLVFLNVLTLQQPEAYVGNAGALFDAEGRVQNEGAEAFLRTFAKSFDRWIDRQRG